MANTISNISDVGGIIAKAAAQTLKDNLVFCNSIDMAAPSDFDGKNGYKAGQTIHTNIPPRFVPQNSFDITSSKQEIVEDTVPLTLDKISTVGMDIDSFEFATEIELKDTIKRIVMPAAESIAQDVEADFIQRSVDATYNQVGTAGTNAFTVADVLASRSKLNQNLAPRAERSLLMDSESGASAVDARKGLFQSSSEIAKQYKDGMIGRSDGFDWYENELVGTHTLGNDVTGVAINGAIAEGASTINVDGLTTSTGTVAKGTVITLAGVFMVHPITKVVTSRLQQFVVTADATANGSGEASLSISPSIYAASGGLRNVSALPADDAVIGFSGAPSAGTNYVQNLAYHKSAFKMVSVPLIMPTNAEFAAMETVDGITVAVIRDFDVNKRTMVTRLDFLGGIQAVRPEWACRLTA